MYWIFTTASPEGVMSTMRGVTSPSPQERYTLVY